MVVFLGGEVGIFSGGRLTSRDFSGDLGRLLLLVLAFSVSTKR